MKVSKILGIGVKILAAAAAGLCVFIGFSKSIDKKPQAKQQLASPTETLEEEKEEDTSLKVVHSLKKFQDTLGKLFSVAQSVSTVSENLYRIFKGGDDLSFGHRPLGNCPQGFTRISSNIIEAGYNPTSSYGANKYWF